MKTAVLLCTAIAAALLCCTVAFKEGDFRHCDDSAFCRRQRNLESKADRYSLTSLSSAVDGKEVIGTVRNNEEGVDLAIKFVAYEKGIFRLQLAESNPLFPRFDASEALDEKALSKVEAINVEEKGSEFVLSLSSSSSSITIQKAPLRIMVKDGATTVLDVNARGLFHFEHQRERQAPANEDLKAQAEAAAKEEGFKKESWMRLDEDGGEKKEEESQKEGEEKKEDATAAPAPVTTSEDSIVRDGDGFWDERWKSHYDSKPRGPTSFGADIAFVGASHVFGIPERAASFSLPPTRAADGTPKMKPYRLYNLDVFEYDVVGRETQPLYGSIPFMIGLGHDGKGARSSGMLWLNAAETYVDVVEGKRENGRDTHWISESGKMDILFFVGPSHQHVLDQYTFVTGRPFMPPRFSTAYHQCRWNYKDEADVLNVDNNFDIHDIPADVIWLDIEHTDGKRYFTWDKALFPDPQGLQNKLGEKGRKMVTIIDPHIKRDNGYHVYKNGLSKDLFVKSTSGSAFDGHCWPGGSSWIDYTSPAAREYWADLFSSYEGATEHLYTWNDMNEPSVFNGPEITMQKDLMHSNNIEHREVHNMYGYYMTMATVDGQAKLRPGQRPFILSRAFFAGSQKHVAIWTGDNDADWSHLAASVPMLLAIGVSGLPFAGADVGGFFRNPDSELLVRWYQVGALQPFFRAHAHIETKRREPWVFDETTKMLIRESVKVRYSLLSEMYTLFREAHDSGAPVMRPLWWEFPHNEDTFSTDDAYMLGSKLYVKPVASAGTTQMEVRLPLEANGDGAWYDFHTGAAVSLPSSNGYLSGMVDTPLEKTPVFIRGGSILARKMRVRRTSALMVNDPFTLTIAPSTSGRAAGWLYLDDGETYNYEKGVFFKVNFAFEKNELVSKHEGDASIAGAHNGVERIVVLGVSTPPRSVTLHAGGVEKSVTFDFSLEKKTLTLRKPDVTLDVDFRITIN